MKIPLSAPDVDDDDIASVVEVLRSGRLSLGPVMERFEAEFADYVGSRHAVAVSSGTAALHLALLALEIGPGDEVIVPSFTFIAAANAIRYVGAKPVFVDIDAITLNMDPVRVGEAITDRTRAVMIVHTFGVPAQMDQLLELALKHGLKIIEDACEALGAEHDGKRVGGFGDAGVFGFYPNKQISTGEGGMLVTERQQTAEIVRSLRNQGRIAGDWFEHQILGYNYRLSEINCALGLSQLRRIEPMLAMRAHVADMYTEALSEIGLSGTGERGREDLLLPVSSVLRGRISWFVYVVRLAQRFGRAHRDTVISKLLAQDIGCGRYFAPIHRQGAYANASVDSERLPVTSLVADRTIALPFFNRLSRDQVRVVTECLWQAIEEVD